MELEGAGPRRLSKHASGMAVLIKNSECIPWRIWLSNSPGLGWT